MEHSRDVEKVISSLTSLKGRNPLENARKVSEELSHLLSSEKGVLLLKWNRKDFEVVLPIFIKIIFHSDRDVARLSLKHCDVVLEIFRSRLPHIKKEEWWIEFEKNELLELVGALKSRVEVTDRSWVDVLTFVTNLVVCDNLHTVPLNKILSVTEYAFKKGRENVGLLEQAWLCWMALIDAFGRAPNILMPSRTISLLLKPLLTLFIVSKNRILTWVRLIEVFGLSGPRETVKSIVGPMCKAMYKSGEKSASRDLPDDCANALIKILSHDHVVEHCLSDVIDVFGACVNSRPSAGLIEQLAGIIVRSINELKDDLKSYKLWKTLVEQYTSCTESPIWSHACENIFTDVQFCRWVDSSTIEGKEIVQLMSSGEFRSKVLLPSIKALTFDDQSETPTKRKSRKGSCEDIWSNYCEAYISWWSNQPPPSPKESEKPESIQSLKDNGDYLAVQFLLLQPLQLNMWNATVFKTWTLLCEACHNQKFLHTFVKAIFDSVDEPNFQVQKAIDVLDCLYKLDNNFCKQSAKLLETISANIVSMEFQNLLDVLSLSETAVVFPEMSSVICKICKNANEKSADYEQLNAHKIRTKVGKIMRKVEQHSNSAEKEKPTKSQRTPFRAQSNFLQRLAKAEEKNRTKSPFLTSIFSGSDTVKDEVENGDGALNDDAASMDTSQENGVIDDSKKPISLMDDSETVPITLPSMLKGTPPKQIVDTEGIAAEKENVISPAVKGVNTAASPRVASPRLKITNAREVKTVTSPAVAKKPKPLAGQKTTPKKMTPSKVSYFDDDANDCVMVPPKPKTTPLTEHQMEMMSKRRTDIPALYQDLSQDTQSQHVAVIQEVTTGVSPRPIQDSQDIVLGTPSPVECAATLTPERQKSARKGTTSAKKLDFNNVSTSPSRTSFMIGSIQEMSPTPKFPRSEEKHSLVDGLTLLSESKDAEPLVNGLSGPEEPQTNSKEKGAVFEESPSVGEEKSKRKRKSEPTKFSPKLTRSKRNLKSSTPDAKFSSLPEPGSKGLRAKSPDCTEKSKAISKSLETHAKMVSVKDPEPPERAVKSKYPESSREGSGSVTDEIKTKDSEAVKKSCDGMAQSSGSQESPELCSKADDALPSSQNAPEVPEPVSQEKPKRKTRKRKIVESDNEPSKKAKTSEEDGSSAAKKIDSAKKKKKPFKLGAGGNLENWLVKTDRVSTPVPEPEVKTEQIENGDSVATPFPEPGAGILDSQDSGHAVTSESKNAGSESLPEDSIADLDNSEEIVPSTQKVENHKPILPVLEIKVEDECRREDVVEVEEEVPVVAIPDDADKRSPEKPEGSVLERLSRESPNDDDIALIISPSKRQKRAPSVFRGEGDTYLTKEKFLTASEEPEEDSRGSVRARNKTTSPTSKKRLQPFGGRSAKMLRLATSSTPQEDNDNIVVTPIRRRESIVPVKYGENWPKGHMEDWVARTPVSPYVSPYRSVLKKTPGPEENVTPQRAKNDSMASPLLSSAKRKRVVFLDPPVTRGLIYELDSSSGSLHHADVPHGSPYPTWKGVDRRGGLSDDAKLEISPSKRDAERLNSLADLKTNSAPKESVQEEASPSKNSKGRLNSQTDLKPFTVSDMSDEVRQLIAEPATVVPTPELDMNQFREKFKLSDDFMTTFSETNAHIRSLLAQCFDSASMLETVDAWKLGESRLVCQMPQSFLQSIVNLNGEVLTDILTSAGKQLMFAVPTDNPPRELSESFAQTEQPTETSSQTQTPILEDSQSQTVITENNTVETNTEVSTATSSTQAHMTLPSIEELPTLFKKLPTQKAVGYLGDALKLLSSLPLKDDCSP